MAGISENGFTLKQYKALEALLSGDSVPVAAAKAECASITVRRWLKETKFKKMYRELRQEIVGQLVTRVIQAGEKAIQTLIANLDGKPEVAVRAAKALLDKVFSIAALEDLKADIDELRESRNKSDGPDDPKTPGGIEANPQGGMGQGSSEQSAERPTEPTPGGTTPPVQGPGDDPGSVADEFRLLDEPEGESPVQPPGG